MKKTNMLTNGYIQFSFLGGKEAKGSLMEATRDENTIMFTSVQQANFEKAKIIIEDILRNNSMSTNSSNVSIADEIEKFSLLKDKGVLTEDEFNQKKKDLLNSKL